MQTIEEWEAEQERKEIEAMEQERANHNGHLRDLRTGEYIREARACEARRSEAAARHDGGVGAITVNGRTCYVEPW